MSGLEHGFNSFFPALIHKTDLLLVEAGMLNTGVRQLSFPIVGTLTGLKGIIVLKGKHYRHAWSTAKLGWNMVCWDLGGSHLWGP